MDPRVIKKKEFRIMFALEETYLGNFFGNTKLFSGENFKSVADVLKSGRGADNFEKCLDVVMFWVNEKKENMNEKEIMKELKHVLTENMFVLQSEKLQEDYDYYVRVTGNSDE